MGAAGVPTTVATAAATSEGRRKQGWRAAPHFTHSSSTTPVVSASQPMPMPVMVGPGRTMEARTPVPSSSICMARAMPSTPFLAAT